MKHHRRRYIAWLVGAWIAGVAVTHAQEYPAPATDIRPDRPLLLFATPPVTPGGEVPASDHIEVIWSEMPAAFRPFAVLEIFVPGTDPDARCGAMRALLERMQAMNIPVALRLADDGSPALPLDRIEPLLQEFTAIRGIEAAGLRFNEYISFGGDPRREWSAPVQWLTDAVDLASRYGRFITLHLAELDWLRIMANVQCQDLYETIRRRHANVIPLNRHTPHHNLARTGALLGTWVEGSVDHWGVEVRSDWYANARFVEPGVYGSVTGDSPPSYPLAAMLLTGFMTGAEVYSFALPDDLWYGTGRELWQTVLAPTLQRALDRSEIAARAEVLSKLHVAYRLVPARNPEEFHLNLHDLDPVVDHGLLIRGTYGIERAGQNPELIPNTGRYYWIPIVSPHADARALDSISEIVGPGRIQSASEWTTLMNTYYPPGADGTAFVTMVGDTTFVMNTRENLYEEQTFRLPSVAAPIRGLVAERGDDGITLTWPLRTGDLRYTVYRRAWPDGVPVPLADDIAAPRYVDASAPESTALAYAVSAITNEQAPYTGTVGLGEYRVVDRYVSPVVEEAVVETRNQQYAATPLEGPRDVPTRARNWWPNTGALPEDQAVVARAIAERIVLWDDAVVRGDLNTVLGLYSTDYRDPVGWTREYVRMAFQWFFQRYSARHMDRQIRAWDFSDWPSAGIVKTQIYLRCYGTAVSDATGRFADLPAWLPTHPSGETWLTWKRDQGEWRITASDPPFPNLSELLAFSEGPYDRGIAGPTP